MAGFSVDSCSWANEYKRTPFCDFNIFKNAAGKFEVPQFIYDKDTKLIFMNAPKRQFNDDIANGNYIKKKS